jgi:hypothetical protein
MEAEESMMGVVRMDGRVERSVTGGEKCGGLEGPARSREVA